MLAARNGGRPVHIVYSTLPRLNRSVRWSSVSPSACSGDMYIGVPAMTPDCVRLASSAARARPKSVILTRGCDAVLQQDVCRLDVAVDQPLGVRGGQPHGDLPADRAGPPAPRAGPSESSFCWSVSPAMNSMTR